MQHSIPPTNQDFNHHVVLHQFQTAYTKSQQKAQKGAQLPSACFRMPGATIETKKARVRDCGGSMRILLDSSSSISKGKQKNHFTRRF
jgi:hypothetical protein